MAIIPYDRVEWFYPPTDISIIITSVMQLVTAWHGQINVLFVCASKNDFAPRCMHTGSHTCARQHEVSYRSLKQLVDATRIGVILEFKRQR